jgi:hypothetical protein
MSYYPTPKALLEELLMENDWCQDQVSVIELGDEELVATIYAAAINGSIKLAEMALIGSLTAYGDYEVLSVSRMVSPMDNTIVSSSLTIKAN